jgi:hypothetical protein
MIAILLSGLVGDRPLLPTYQNKSGLVALNLVERNAKA